ncbi:MAG: hypothetical protein H7336_07630 [Bacteriovorax sp.]|nr:hypothetical protein [Bacteriovorax sp.]
MKALVTFLIFCLISLNSYAAVATHGMVLFGHQKLLAYHLPMFHKVHAHQVVFEFTVPEEVRAKIIAAYGVDNFLTFVPDPFDLEKFLVAPHPLKGDIYSGHFEKDGVVIMNDVTLETPKIIYQGGLIKENGNSTENYILAGTPFDLFLIHLLDGGKQQDQIVSAKIEVWSHDYVLLAQRAIDSNAKLESSTGLLKYNEINKVELPLLGIMNKKDPACYPMVRRDCKIYDYPAGNELEVITQKDYFSDSVM